MRMAIKVWLIIAGALVLLGGGLFVGVMSALHWDFTALSTEKYQTNVYEIGEKFESISVLTDTSDVVFMPSDDGGCRVVCHEPEKRKHSALVEDNTLVIRPGMQKSWHHFIGISFDSPKITVYLPADEYDSLLIRGDTGDVEIPSDVTFREAEVSLSTGDVSFRASVAEILKIKTSTGGIRVEQIGAASLELTASTGDVSVSDVRCDGMLSVVVTTGRMTLTDVTCGSIVSSGGTGDAVLTGVISAEKISVERSTGDVRLERSDASELFVKTDTGDVSGTLLTEKVFIAQTDTGRVDVPHTVTGGRCEITTTTGNVTLAIAEGE